MSASVLFGLLPGIRALQARHYLSAARDTAMFAIALAACASLFGVLWMAPLALLLLFSEGYRTLYAQHRQRCDESLQTQPLESTDLASVMGLFRRPAWWLPVLNWPWLPIAFVALCMMFLGRSTHMS